jgi:hypothetical protein
MFFFFFQKNKSSRISENDINGKLFFNFGVTSGIDC